MTLPHFCSSLMFPTCRHHLCSAQRCLLRAVFGHGCNLSDSHLLIALAKHRGEYVRPTCIMRVSLLLAGESSRNGDHNRFDYIRNRHHGGSSRRWGRNGNGSSRRNETRSRDNSSGSSTPTLGRHISQRQSVGPYLLLVIPGKGARKRNGIPRWQRGEGLNLHSPPRK